MFDQVLFKAKFTTGQTIRLNTDGGTMLDSCAANIGVLQGKARTVAAILCDGATDQDQWQILNIVNDAGMFLDHVAIKGAVNDDQAHRLCKLYLGEARQGNIRNQESVTANGLKTFLDSAKLPHNTPYFLQADAALLDAQGTVSPAIWNDDVLVSHGGRLSQMMLDMANCDIEGQLLEQVTPRDIVAMLIDEHCQIGMGMFDAMIIKYNQFEKVLQKMALALKAADNEEFFVKSVTPIEPFKRAGVVNVGIIFEMSDTQTITLLFNNPDTTPSKLTGTDILTSWKWILNKRDVTAILQPRAVDALKYPQIASRMLKLLARNHDRFKRAQAAKNKDELLLNELISQVEASQLELRTLQQAGTDIQGQIDAETIKKQQADSAIAAKKQSEVDTTAGDISKSDAVDHARKLVQEYIDYVYQPPMSLMEAILLPVDELQAVYQSEKVRLDQMYVEVVEKIKKLKFNVGFKKDAAVFDGIASEAYRYDKYGNKAKQAFELFFHEVSLGKKSTASNNVEKSASGLYEVNKSIPNVIIKQINAVNNKTGKSAGLIINAKGNVFKEIFEADINQLKNTLATFLESKGLSLSDFNLIDGEDVLGIQNDTDAAQQAVIDKVQRITDALIAEHGFMYETSLKSTNLVKELVSANGYSLSIEINDADDIELDSQHMIVDTIDTTESEDYIVKAIAQREFERGLDFDHVDEIEDEDSIYFGKTADYAFTVEQLKKSAVACNLKIVFGDFAKTGAMAGLFDSVDAQGQLVYGITAQIGKDGKVLARASVDRDGNLTLFTGNNGDQVLASLKTDQATQKNIVEVLQKLNTGADQAGQDAETIVLTGNELGDFPDTPEGKKALRAAAKTEFEKLLGQWVDCPAVGGKVEIRKLGMKKILSTSADSRKLKIIAKIDSIISNSKLVKTIPPYDSEQDISAKAYHIAHSKLMLEDQETNVRIVIKEDVNGKFHYDHSILGKVEDKLLDSLQEKSPLKSELNSVTTSNDGGTYPSRLASHQLEDITPQGENLVNGMFDDVSKTKYVLNLFIEGEDEQSEQSVQTNNEQNATKSVYVIKNPKPRARKPLGTVKVDVVDEVFFTVFVSMDGVGGEYVGDLDGAQNWLTHRLMGMGEAMSGKAISFADVAAKLSLQIGEDVLGINDVPNPYAKASLIDLAKGVVKELVALGWESSGSTATKAIEVNGQSVPLKFQFDPFAKGREIFISRDGDSSIASFGMPEMSEAGVKAKATELNDAANVFFASQASITDEQNVQTNNNEQNFLNDVIAGNVDLLADETGNRIEQIGENLDPSLEALFEQAIEAYSQAALKNAQNLG